MYTIMTTKHYLTDHARLRLAERSTLTEAEFLSLADCCAALVYRADAQTHYEMIWSSKDQNGYVLVVSPVTGAIVTIKSVLAQSGHPCKIHDAARKPNRGHENDVGVAKITSSMLEQAVLAAGADPSEAQKILDILKPQEKASVAPRAWHYRWTLRYLYSKPGGGVTSKTVTFGKSAEIQMALPDGMLHAAEEVVKTAEGWDAVLLLVERDSNEEVGMWPVTAATVA